MIHAWAPCVYYKNERYINAVTFTFTFLQIIVLLVLLVLLYGEQPG